MLGPPQWRVNSNYSRCAAMTALAASLPPGNVDAARMQCTITPEYMCYGCDCRRILVVIRSCPANSNISSSLPNALKENGQVGSRNNSNRRGPRPPVKGSAFHVAVWLIQSIPIFRTLPMIFAAHVKGYWITQIHSRLSAPSRRAQYPFLFGHAVLLHLIPGEYVPMRLSPRRTQCTVRYLSTRQYHYSMRLRNVSVGGTDPRSARRTVITARNLIAAFAGFRPNPAIPLMPNVDRSDRIPSGEHRSRARSAAG